jgi:hypothetical protein
MSYSAAIFAPRSAYDRFLYAVICEQKNGAPLSVLSAFAQLDLDPWEEAARLARLPRRHAVTSLRASIAALPADAIRDLDTTSIAVDLLALLPRHAGPELPIRASWLQAGASIVSRASKYIRLGR